MTEQPRPAWHLYRNGAAMTNPDRLAQIRARTNAATSGPWWAWNRGVGYEIAVGPAAADGHPDRLLPEGERTSIGRAEDAEFITHARQDVPWLLGRLDAVAALHQSRHGVLCDTCDEVWPCPTLRAATGTDDQAAERDGKVGT